MSKGGGGRGAKNTFSMHPIDVRTLFFHSELALGHEDTCTPRPVYCCSAFGSRPKEDR